MEAEAEAAWEARDLAGLAAALARRREGVAPEAWRRAWLGKEGAEGVRKLEGAVRACAARVRRAVGVDQAPEALAWAEGSPDAVVVELLAELARTVRNLQASPEGQERLWALSKELVGLLGHVPMLHGGGTFEAWQSRVLALARVLPQVASNACVGRPAHACELAQDETVRAGLRDAAHFAGSMQDWKLAHYVLYLAYMLVLPDAACAAHVASDAQLLASLVQLAALALVGLPAPGKGPEEGAKAEETGDPARVETHRCGVWLVGQLVEAGQGEALVALIGGPLGEPVLSLWLGHRLEQEDQEPEADAQGDLEAAFGQLSALYCAPDREKVGGRALLLRLIASYAMDPRVYVREPCKAGLLHVLLGELEAATRAAADPDAPFGLRVELLRAVSNLCHGRRANQDAVRAKEGGLYTVLNQCGVDEKSPFLREWAIMAIRNLCEGNEENQRVVADLRVQGTVDNSLIEKAGMRVELTEDGRPELKRL